MAKQNTVSVEIFAAGDGINYPKKGNTVVLHYSGYLPNGKLFDSVRFYVISLFFIIYEFLIISNLKYFFPASTFQVSTSGETIEIQTLH